MWNDIWVASQLPGCVLILYTALETGILLGRWLYRLQSDGIGRNRADELLPTPHIEMECPECGLISCQQCDETLRHIKGCTWRPSTATDASGKGSWTSTGEKPPADASGAGSWTSTGEKPPAMTVIFSKSSSSGPNAASESLDEVSDD